MPVTFKIDTKTSAVFTTATGTVSYADVIEYLNAKARAGIMTKDELIDGRNITLDLSHEDLPAVAGEMRRARGDQTAGRTAVVTNSNVLFSLARTYAELIKDSTPHFEVFSDISEARRWLFDETP